MDCSVCEDAVVPAAYLLPALPCSAGGCRGMGSPSKWASQLLYTLPQRTLCTKAHGHTDWVTAVAYTASGREEKGAYQRSAAW